MGSFRLGFCLFGFLIIVHRTLEEVQKKAREVKGKNGDYFIGLMRYHYIDYIDWFFTALFINLPV